MFTSKDKKIEVFLKFLIKNGVSSIRGEFRIFNNKLNHISCIYRFKPDPDAVLPESYDIKLNRVATTIVENVTSYVLLGDNPKQTDVKAQDKKKPVAHELLYDIIDTKINEFYNGNPVNRGFYMFDASHKQMVIYFDDSIVFNKTFF